MYSARMLTIPVSEDFYNQFRILAAENNLTIAGYGRQLLEKAMSESRAKLEKPTGNAKPVDVLRNGD